MTQISKGDKSALLAQISSQQQRVLAVIQQWVERCGYPPTVREIGQAVGLSSPSAVTHHLDALQRHGFLTRQSGPRAIRLLVTAAGPQAPAEIQVPLLGSIAAGTPILADESIEDWIPLPAMMTGKGVLFALRVRGDSMIDAAICDGDVVVVRQQPDAEQGDIVAALLDDEATVKQFRRDGGHVQLVPRNPDYPIIDGDHATILGKVTLVLRQL
ncbi:transcriptional repressor LexA [Actinoplanes sp. NPDC026670]|uniref:transcriptional repressor LexA n=1 Tax=Actinoplanes sp. NPDC026670 TaxID=3154700 RepID=UPI0033C146BA